MRRRSLVSMILLFTGLLLVDAPVRAQATGSSALEEGNALIGEIRGLISDMASGVSAAESAQPAQTSVASCLGQIVQSLTSLEATAVAALGGLEAAVSSGDSGAAQAQLSVIKLANKTAKGSAASSSACQSTGVAGAGTDANGDGVPDDAPSTGGISGLDELQGDEEFDEGFSAEEFVPDGDSVDEPATSDVVTSPAVTP